MKIKSVRIKNYHSIVDCEFNLPDLLTLVGENNVGKSNIIYAFNLFFSKEKPRDKYSFNNLDEPIEITVTFEALTENEKSKITEDHREGDEFILKKIYTYDPARGIEKNFTSVKNDEDTNLRPRGFENVLSDALPAFYLLPALTRCSEETKLVKTTNFGKFLDLIFQKMDSDFLEWDNKINELRKEAEKIDMGAPLIKVAQEISQVLKDQFSDADVKLKPQIATRADILKTLDVFINDDRDLPIFNKGQGTQRAFIFAILRVLAKKLNEERPVSGKEKKGIIIAIEEPELYLHPHQQKIIYSLLKGLTQQTSEQIQIIYSTHSSFMVHIEDYQYIGMVRKPDVSTGTKLFQYTEEIFLEEPKREFQLMCQFDPERNELFFAKKIIFVEGNTEKVSLPAILNMVNINPIAEGISIIECGGKGGIKLFVNVVNAFNMTNYLVMYDKDSGEIAERENKELEKICRKDSAYPFSPKFTKELKLESDSPYLARREILDKKIAIPSNLKEFFVKNL